MSQPQYPQQPGWNGPQQPGQPQPGWGGPQQPWGPPPPPKKRGIGKMIGFGCLGFIAVIVLFGIIGALSSSGGSNTSSRSNDTGPAASAPKSEPPATDDKPSEPKKPKTVVFKVWGTAPPGALGSLDITYGSDSDNRDGKWKNGQFTATLPLDKDAMYYSVMAQLQGSGDIQCSVTVDGHTEKAHASGGYNICHAQANAGLFGGWGG